MFDLTRRHAIKLLGSAAALVGLPFHKALGAAATASLHDAVKNRVTALSKGEIAHRLHGAYYRIFQIHKSTMQVERVAHVAYMGLHAPNRKLIVRDTFDKPDTDRWVYNFETYEMGLGFAVVEDNDPRAGIVGSDREPTLLGMQALRHNVENVPWRRSDVPAALNKLLQRFRDQREQDAAAILNNALTYDTSVVGDGKPLVSASHPHDSGMWANRFDKHLSASSLNEALAHIEREWVDEHGTKITGKGRLLIVPTALAETAATLDFPHLVWDALTNPNAWFVVTANQGLVWFERDPLELDTWHDVERDMVMVKGYERRCFGCSDPRAVLGAFPA